MIKGRVDSVGREDIRLRRFEDFHHVADGSILEGNPGHLYRFSPRIYPSPYLFLLLFWFSVFASASPFSLFKPAYGIRFRADLHQLVSERLPWGLSSSRKSLKIQKYFCFLLWKFQKTLKICFCPKFSKFENFLLLFFEIWFDILNPHLVVRTQQFETLNSESEWISYEFLKILGCLSFVVFYLNLHNCSCVLWVISLIFTSENCWRIILIWNWTTILSFCVFGRFPSIQNPSLHVLHVGINFCCHVSLITRLWWLKFFWNSLIITVQNLNLICWAFTQILGQISFKSLKPIEPK